MPRESKPVLKSSRGMRDRYRGLVRLCILERVLYIYLLLRVGVLQLISIIFHTVYIIITIKVVLHGMKFYFNNTFVAYTAECGQDKKQDFKSILRLLKDFLRSNKEGYVIDTLEVSLKITDIRSQ